MKGKDDDHELKDVQPSWAVVVITIMLAVVLLAIAQWSVTK